MERPTIGRTVHFVLPGGAHRPAVVTEVPDSGGVHLHVSTRYGDRWTTSVTYQAVNQADNVPQDEETKAERTWHWPEREPARQATEQRA